MASDANAFGALEQVYALPIEAIYDQRVETVEWLIELAAEADSLIDGLALEEVD
jgi:hypothetical protein